MSSRSKPTNSNFIVGVALPELICDAATSLRRAREDGFDYVITSLPNTASSASSSSNHGVGSSTIRTDVTQLESKWWSTSIVGIVGDPPDFRFIPSDSDFMSRRGRHLIDALTDFAESVQVKANQIFWGMMEWASHMNIPAVILPSIPDGEFFIEEEDGCLTTMACTNINCDAAKEYARVLANLAASPICASSHIQLWVRVSLCTYELQAFQLLLSRCDHAPCIGCMLHIDQPIDAAELPNMLRELHPFLGGGFVKAISWDTSIFLKNKKGFPTLSKSHQFLFSFLYGRLGRTLRTLVEGNVVDSSMQGGGGSSSRLFILQYLRHLRSRDPLPDKLDSEEAILETSYLDTLQSPLQPLGDHLEYQTYETFEKDPVKYKRYGEAIENELIDGFRASKFPLLGVKRLTLRELKRLHGVESDLGTLGSEMHEVYVHEVTILVVGAGRGPLVKEAIGAVARASGSIEIGGSLNTIHAKIIAIEKNPSAVLYLQSLKASDPSWNDRKDPHHDDDMFDPNDDDDIANPGTSNVTVICCDMREATSHPILRNMIMNERSRADIVVSELLGSFGDNELSPECLDGVQKCGILKVNCVSIPQSYTAYIAPVSSARLHSEAKIQSCHPLNNSEGPASPAVGMQRAMETPYVVRSHAASQTHPEAECWKFYHPQFAAARYCGNDPGDKHNASALAAENVNNDRHAHISFKNDPSNGCCFGCGYGALDTEVQPYVSANPEGILQSSSEDVTLTIHGFLGTFHSVLYRSYHDGGEVKKESVISIAPHSFSVGMFSWFPLYFPLKEPLRVPPGATLTCSIWRRSDEDRVWYEWCAEVVVVPKREPGKYCDCTTVLAASSLHNPGGRSYHVKK